MELQRRDLAKAVCVESLPALFDAGHPCQDCCKGTATYIFEAIRISP